ncbi:TraB/GumN family protein [Pseudofulvimonas gallinarii]|jgi:pheromone shutdown-related protein TraB|uniref:Pheromone shutdown-related protein TraB n=1 Tax=Pseudofulvimonas gallinarii TaxID=634155 RepID=A0A4S3L0D1_9GAMM|nr:TraB/GumN family protein [Pseudofulvimonas gallinarii]TCT01274.1 pheromone shutdown-related protein TraB [Pseudofulvimonas gallinarii]THD15036.1 conjugal transfer protein TraB [Pseudofulvimonas gallinarii]
MTTAATLPVDLPALEGQPVETVERDGVRFTLLGTAHVSHASVEAVRAAIASGRFDAVAVELCDSRHQALIAPERLQQLDLFQVLRDGKAGMVAAQLLLASYQARLAEQLGIEPGAELRTAVKDAGERGLPVWLIDREIGVTVGRAYRSVGFWQRMGLASGLIASLLSNDHIGEDEIEKLKEGDMLDSAFREFAMQSQPLYTALIAERDAFMAARLRQQVGQDARPREVLVVIGAGHLQGLGRALAGQTGSPVEQVAELQRPPPPRRWPKWLGYGLVAFLLGGFAWGFSQGRDVGAELLIFWVLATGGLGAIGCIAAGGHPASVAAAFVASPLTPLHPALGSGTISAAVELWARKPTVADFGQLRHDLKGWRGWWRNRVARVLVNFFLTSLGTAIGVWLAGAKMIKALFSA